MVNMLDRTQQTVIDPLFCIWCMVCEHHQNQEQILNTAYILESIVSKALTLSTIDKSSNFGAIYGPQALPCVIPELKDINS